MTEANFFNLSNPDQGIARQLAEGMTTRIFSGEQAMLSVVKMEANARGQIHSHPQEQWGVLLEGSGVRIQNGREVTVNKGDFWRTPGGVPHGFRAGPSGATVLDVFAPPREEYKRAGQGFETA